MQTPARKSLQSASLRHCLFFPFTAALLHSPDLPCWQGPDGEDDDDDDDNQPLLALLPQRALKREEPGERKEAGTGPGFHVRLRTL